MKLQTVEGTYENGTIHLAGPAPDVRSARVLVTFLQPGAAVDLSDCRIAEEDAADLRGRLKAFAMDWDRPEMDVYDAV